MCKVKVSFVCLFKLAEIDNRNRVAAYDTKKKRYCAGCHYVTGDIGTIGRQFQTVKLMTHNKCENDFKCQAQ